jgi:hypothetical protein
MGVGPVLSKGDDGELVRLEELFLNASRDELRQFRNDLSNGATVIAAIASLDATVNGNKPKFSNVELNLYGANWYGQANHQWREPCTPGYEIHNRVRDALIGAVDLSTGSGPAAKWPIELWAICGHPNFQATVTARPDPALVVVTFLTPDMHAAEVGAGAGYLGWASPPLALGLKAKNFKAPYQVTIGAAYGVGPGGMEAAGNLPAPKAKR